VWPRWLADALGGKTSLARAFWLYGLGVSVVYSLIGLLVDAENVFGAVAYVLFGVALGVLQTIILWRCADNSRSRLLGRLVRATMIFGLIVAALMIYLLFQLKLDAAL
jgi:hypothetical protein